MEKEQLTKAGMKVLAELHNERINDHLFVIRDYDGDLMIIHSYLNGLDETPMVEFYLESAFTRREQRKLRRNPQAFLEKFNGYMLRNMADFVMEEREWLADKALSNQAEGGEKCYNY